MTDAAGKTYTVSVDTPAYNTAVPAGSQHAGVPVYTVGGGGGKPTPAANGPPKGAPSPTSGAHASSQAAGVYGTASANASHPQTYGAGPSPSAPHVQASSAVKVGMCAVGLVMGLLSVVLL
jgi:hypothetical protein